MSESRRGTKILIGLLMAAVVGLAIALLWVTRTPRSDAAETRQPEAPAPERSHGGFASVQERPGIPSRPPARARNELGQPLNEDGRPIGPPEKLAQIRNEPIAPGDVPITPPLFDDPAQRAAFKGWWVEEVSRRVAIYRELEPDMTYPPPGETSALLADFYDAAEPRGPDESVEQAIQRRQRWHELWQEFLDSHGATLYTTVSRGGDPQYGKTPPPPVQPPGIPDADAPPAEPAADSPPGTSGQGRHDWPARER